MLLAPWTTWASGGYDNGTPAGEGKIDIELTWNPSNIVEDGQSYVVWGYGLTDRLDFHGYISHEARGTDQIYYGLMYNFFQHRVINLSTAIGLRHRKGLLNMFAPQLLFTLKLVNNFDLIGSAVHVYDLNNDHPRGMTMI
ncbi:MAG TPA: hypothetical protein EYP39_04095 [Ghiorsea sp.]|nr:hypothetical protein [Ghiorsea sp.]HIP07097.1 hypothetical protein [Mariprofundaceae bacterium]